MLVATPSLLACRLQVPSERPIPGGWGETVDSRGVREPCRCASAVRVRPSQRVDIRYAVQARGGGVQISALLVDQEPLEPVRCACRRRRRPMRLGVASPSVQVVELLPRAVVCPRTGFPEDVAAVHVERRHAEAAPESHGESAVPIPELVPQPNQSLSTHRRRVLWQEVSTVVLVDAPPVERSVARRF